MLKKDPKLPFLDIAWSSSRMGEFLNRNVLPILSPGQQVTAVAIEDMTYTPARECAILYSLQFDGQLDNPSRWAVVTFSKDDRLQKVYPHPCSENTELAGAPALGPVMLLPQYRCLVEFFPMDWRLPAVVQALEPGKIASLLTQIGTDGDHSQAYGCSEINVRRYRPHRRCLLRYGIESLAGKGPTEMIGKVYPRGPKAGQVWQALQSLHVQGKACGVIIPQPLVLQKEWNFVLMERVSGTSMKQVLEVETQAKDTTRLVAAVLATFHSLHFESLEVRSFETELAQLRKRVARLHMVAPLLAQQAETLLHRITPLVPPSASVVPSFIHGDCKPSQFLIDKSQVAVVDFDRACLGDPAIDVGNFMAALRKEAVCAGQDYSRQLSTHFLAEYQAHSARDGLVERASLFQSIALTRMAVRRFQRAPRSYARRGANSHSVLLLEEAARCLAEL